MRNEYEMKNVFKIVAILLILLPLWLLLIIKWWAEPYNLFIFILIWLAFIAILCWSLFYNLKIILKRVKGYRAKKLWNLKVINLKVTWFKKSGDEICFYTYDWLKRYDSEYFDCIVKNYDWDTSEFLERMHIVYCPLDINITLKQMQEKSSSDFELNWFEKHIVDNIIWGVIWTSNDNSNEDNKYSDYDELDEEYKANYEQTEKDKDEDDVYIEPTISTKITKYNLSKLKEIYKDLHDSLWNKKPRKPYMKLKNWKLIHVWDHINVHVDQNNPDIYRIDTEKYYK